MNRQERIGCWTVFFAPFFVVAAVALWVGFTKMATLGAEGFPWLLGMLAIALLFGGLPLLAVRFYAGPKPPPPPPDESVAPRPGAVPRGPGPGVPPLANRLGRTWIHVEQWEPGRLIRLRQKGGSAIPASVLTLLGLGLLFVGEPTLAQSGFDGQLRVGLPRPGSLALGLWALTLLFLAARPRPARVVTFDWAADAIENVRGRRRRVLGMSRLKWLEWRDRDIRVQGGEGSARSGSLRQVLYSQQLIAWIEPDAAAAAPFLLVETGPARWHRAQHDREAMAELLEGLAAALAVPHGATEHIGDRDAYE